MVLFSIEIKIVSERVGFPKSGYDCIGQVFFAYVSVLTIGLVRKRTVDYSRFCIFGIIFYIFTLTVRSSLFKCTGLTHRQKSELIFIVSREIDNDIDR